MLHRRESRVRWRNRKVNVRHALFSATTAAIALLATLVASTGVAADTGRVEVFFDSCVERVTGWNHVSRHTAPSPDGSHVLYQVPFGSSGGAEWVVDVFDAEPDEWLWDHPVGIPTSDVFGVAISNTGRYVAARGHLGVPSPQMANVVFDRLTGTSTTIAVRAAEQTLGVPQFDESDRLYFHAQAGATTEVLRHDLTTGVTQVLTSTIDGTFLYDVAHDGRFIYFSDVAGTYVGGAMVLLDTQTGAAIGAPGSRGLGLADSGTHFAYTTVADTTKRQIRLFHESNGSSIITNPSRDRSIGGLSSDGRWILVNNQFDFPGSRGGFATVAIDLNSFSFVTLRDTIDDSLFIEQFFGLPATDGDGTTRTFMHESNTFGIDVVAFNPDGFGGTDPCSTIDVLAPDSDGDGVRDDVDNCRTVPNADQEDTDQDLIGDACDDDDIDGDGVLDHLDNCLSFPNLEQRDRDGDGVGNVCDELNIVALGDSYISGEGAGHPDQFRCLTDFDTTPSEGLFSRIGHVVAGGRDEPGPCAPPGQRSTCRRSLDAWPERLADDLDAIGRFGGFSTLACSGAETRHIISEPAQDPSVAPSNTYGNRPQIEELVEIEHLFGPIDVVFVSLGGNDGGFGDLLGACAGEGVGRLLNLFRNIDDCSSEAAQNSILEAARQVYVPLAQALFDIREAAPSAEVHLVSYPVPLSATTPRCKELPRNLTGDEIAFVEQVFVPYLTEVQQAAAERVGVRFIDIQSSLVGNRPCESSDAAFNVVATTGGTHNSFHPNDFGHELFNNAIQTALGGIGLGSRFGDDTLPDPGDRPESSEADDAPVPNAVPLEDLNRDRGLFERLVIDRLGQIRARFERDIVRRAEVHIRSDPVLLGSVDVGPDGEVVFASDEIPASVTPGLHTLIVSGLDETGAVVAIASSSVLVGPVDGSELVESDLDSDGLPNDSDPCPYLAGDGGGDADSDGIGNGCDADFDADSDGVPDTSDNCPAVANADQLNSDTDALGDACDTNDDNDGLRDADDPCPIVFGVVCPEHPAGIGSLTIYDTETGPGDSFGYGIAAEEDGRFAVVGSLGLAPLVGGTMSLDSGGTIDSVFAGDGRAELDHGTRTQAQSRRTAARAVTTLPDGRVVVAGTTSNPPGSSLFDDVFVTLLDMNGAPDASFGTGGTVILAAGNGASPEVELATDSTSIYLGWTQSTGSAIDGRVAKFDLAGGLDPLFGANGVLDVDLPGFDSRHSIQSLLIDSDGLWMSGAADFGNAAGKTNLFVTRFDASTGAVDAGWSGDGISTANFTATFVEGIGHMVRDGDGVVVAGAVLGGAQTQLTLARFDGAGGLDAGFGTGGMAATGLRLLPRDIERAVDGRLYIVGDYVGEFAALAIDGSTGALVADFGVNGLGVFESTTSDSVGGAVIVNDELYVFGTASNAGAERWAFTATSIPLADSDPPVVTGVPDRAPDQAPWYTAPVTIDWMSVDPAPSAGPASDPADMVAALEGIHTYESDPSCDAVGLCATGMLELSIDTVAPTIAWTGNAGMYGVDEVISITCSVADSNSGLATASCDEVSGLAYDFVGATLLSGAATDVAGNVTNDSTSFDVVIDVDDVNDLIDSFVTKPQTASQLKQKFADIVAAPPNLKAQKLAVFINFVNAKVGTDGLTPAEAAVLVSLATAVANS